ncbi:glycerophosphodiester phosphodiesterase 1-like [Dermacentor andersoni]|uniref:glycerophosphodiester phosphodiesterase 1-like n=1 Tax=Dermacentor andersoni TaxID=34620 RepID=UPI0021556E87|nr:glycerophosphodiester phosphodiesterase 1-like [Dermacentor andersoni]
MVSYCVVAMVVALCCWAFQRLSIPRVDDDLASEVILGVQRDDGSQLPPVFGHRGGGLDAPENTLAAFLEAKKNHAYGIEFDLCFTRDDVAVIFHDETLERTTNGTGRVEDTTFEELRRLDASCKHPLAQRFPAERVPTLGEAVEECLRLDMRLIIDVKKYDYRAVRAVDKLFRKRDELYRRALVASFYPQFVYALRSRNPAIVTALTWRPGFLTYEDINNTRPRYESRPYHWTAQVADWLLDKALHTGLLPHLTGASAVLISTNMMGPEYVRAWRKRGVHVIAWTSNHAAEKDFLRRKLRVPIITDTMRQV